MFRLLILSLLVLSLSAPALAQKEEPLEGISLDQYVKTWPQLKDCAALVAKDRLGARRCTDDLIHNGVATAGAANLKAQILREDGDLDGATAAIAQAIKLEEGQDLHHYQSGQIILTKVRKTSNPLSQWRLASQANTEFERAFEINPRPYPYRRHLAINKLQSPALMGGDKAGAITLATDGIAQGVNENYLLRAYANFILEKPAEAFADVDKGISLGAFDNAIVLKAAKTAVDANDWTRAEKYYQYVVTNKPQSARSHYYIGTFYAKKGDAARASAAFETALRLDPDYRLASDHLAQLRKGR